MRPLNPLEVRDREVLKEAIDQSTRTVKHSVRSLAEMTGVSHATIGDLLTGRKTRVTVELAECLSEILGVPVEDLFVPTVSEFANANDLGRGDA
jgi:transcriptional regulator with XRE-family HTH domain